MKLNFNFAGIFFGLIGSPKRFIKFDFDQIRSSPPLEFVNSERNTEQEGASFTTKENVTGFYTDV